MNLTKNDLWEDSERGLVWISLGSFISPSQIRIFLSQFDVNNIFFCTNAGS